MCIYFRFLSIFIEMLFFISGLPNNKLTRVPIEALVQLQGLDRLDLSHNKLKSIENDSFVVNNRSQ